MDRPRHLRRDGADFFSNRRAFKRGEPDYGRLLSAISHSTLGAGGL